MEKFYSCEEVASRFGVKIDTVWSWVREKKLPAFKIGKFYRVKAADLEAFENSRRTISDENGNEAAQEWQLIIDNN